MTRVPPMDDPPPDDACRNCGTPLRGAFCHACGQKRFIDADRRLGHLIGEGFRELSAVDGKLWRSLRMLLFRPGLASREYLDGRRVRYYSPIGLFVLANVLYFFAPALSDFNLAFADQVPGRIALQAQDPAHPFPPARREYLRHSGGQVHSRWTAPFVEGLVARRHANDPSYDVRRLASDYDREAGNVGKTLMIAHVPVIALVLALVYVRKRRYFAEHFVVALHLFAFVLLFVQIVFWPLHWLSDHTSVDLSIARIPIVLAVAGSLLGYILVACRTAYRTGWPAAVAGLLGVLGGLFVANVVVYRALQFLVTLWLV